MIFSKGSGLKMRKKLIAGNWKMYKSVADAEHFALEWAKDAPSVETLIFCQAPLLPVLAQGKAPFLFGPQSIYWEEKGAFTGELSPKLAKDLGCAYALAGHSERRQFFGESNESAAKRALAAHSFGMKAVFCLGESLAERDAGKTFEVIRAQCASLFALSPKAPEGFCFAYEPVWAIGTGRTATTAQAQEAHAFLRKEISAAWGAEAANKIRLLYGGSVKPENAKELMSQPDVDGVLVGGASLEPASFLAIAAAGKQ
jgi:triosephosphate isomerase